MLVINDLSIRVAGRLLIDGASVRIPDGARVGLVGRNGTGKTTLFHVITGELAAEHGKHNIRVNCIAPGLIKTDFAKALWDNPENLKASTARSPLLRIGIPDEIAGAAVFLGSAAGNFMTGQTMVIDGGATIS